MSTYEEPSSEPSAAPPEATGGEAAPAEEPARRSVWGMIVSHALVAIFASVIALVVARAVGFGPESVPASNGTATFQDDFRGEEPPPSPDNVPGTNEFGGLTPPGTPPGVSPNGPAPSAAANGPSAGVGNVPVFPGPRFGMGNRPPGAWPRPGDVPSAVPPALPATNVPGIVTPPANAAGPPRPTPPVPSPDEIAAAVLPVTPLGAGARPRPGDLEIERRVDPEPAELRRLLLEAARIAREQGPVAAARRLERYAERPDHVASPRLYATIGTLWLKVGDADRALTWIQKAAEALAPPAEIPPPGQPPMPPTRND